MRYRRLQTLGFAALLATITAIHCLPTEVQADRRRWTTYGSDRGRLVVACDMRSDTCSDGRQITTTRATPVPCETSPGVWEMVPEDTGCYGVRGLESWAQTTSYLSYGAELDQSPWGPSTRGGSLTQIDDGWRVFNNPLEVNSGWGQRIPVEEDNETWTTSYIIRTWYPLLMAFYAGTSQSCGQGIRDTGAKWATFSCTRQVPKPSDPAALIYPGANTTGASHYVDVKAAWTVKGATPGRPCWGGEAPVTCGGEVSEISTAGWPTTHGSIEIEFRIDEAPQDFAIILDGRSSATVGFNIHYARATGRLNHRQGDRVMEGPTITLGTWYRVRLEREGGDVRMYVNGVLGAAESDWPAWSYPYKSGMALLGRYTVAAQFYVNGSISNLRIRSFE